jgi:sugar (pentulose or hexulose) kinase
LAEISLNRTFSIQAINFSAYGASFVFIDKDGHAVAPLYSYLKQYPEHLKKKFYTTYGGEERFSFQTASPVLGSLNSGMQLYRLKHERPSIFNKVRFALHLPQYLSFLLTGKSYADITSIGCHTNLWDFQKNDYHKWVMSEGIFETLPPIVPANHLETTSLRNTACRVGVGLHDSSAALIPYLTSFHEPFVLISTGTWCISLNPFNCEPLTASELENDCLCYLQFDGKPAKASRFFGGHIHEQQINRIAAHFQKDTEFYKAIDFNPGTTKELDTVDRAGDSEKFDSKESVFQDRNLREYDSAEMAYHQLMHDMVQQQCISTKFVLGEGNVKRIFVDGGFSANSLYMNLLAKSFPDHEVYGATIAQATALGAALVIHDSWNSKPLPKNLVALKHYTANQ